MNSRKTLLTLLGGWILYIGLDAVYGKMASAGAGSLLKPLRMVFSITGTVRTAVLFLLAVSTFFLVAALNKKEKAAEGGRHSP